ncbi:MAG: polymer-forming cytoskeletal protein [Methanobacteriota archaeon]
MELKDMMRKLDEKFANGEVSEETYKEIKLRYESEAQAGDDSRKGKSPSGAKGGGERAPVIRVSGCSDHPGDMFAVKVEVSGASDVGGDVDAEEVEISGACDVAGSVKASKSFHASGSCDIEGNVESPDIQISGACDIEGSVSGDAMRVSGASDITGDVNVGKCVLSGAVDIRGTIKARELKFSGASEMKDIEAETVEGRGLFVFGKMTAKKVSLRLVDLNHAESVEADEIEIKLHRDDGRLKVKKLVAKGRLDIDGVIAEEVSGGEVVIGPHCRIGLVKGGKVEVDPKAKVDKVAKL